MSERQAASSVTSIRREEYAPFESQKHLFLAGDLKLPNPHPFIRDPRLEWIFCFYEAGDDGIPHWHRDVTEYETVLEGEEGYVESLTREISWFRPGDLIVIPAGVCVKRMIQKPARTIAIKVPSSSERVVCSECPRQCPSRVSPYLGEMVSTKCE